MPDDPTTPPRWIDSVLVTDDPSDAFLATLRADLTSEWRGETRMRVGASAPAPVSSGRRFVVLAGLTAAAVAAVVTAVVVNRDDSIRIAPADRTTVTTPAPAPAVVPATTIPGAAPTPTNAPGPTTEPPTAPSTSPPAGSPETTVPGALVGAWLSPAGERLTLLESGLAAIGPCDPAGSWSVDGVVVSISGFDAVGAQACAGTISSRRPLTTALGAGPIEATVTADDALTVTIGGAPFVLAPAPGAIPEFDLDTGAAYGFAPFADIPIADVTEIVSRRAGQPDYDSGWYVIPPDPRIPEGDCMPGMRARAIAWGPVSFVFLEFGGTERLWISGYGEHRRLVEAAETSGRPLSSAVTDADLASLPSTLDELAGGGYTVDGLAVGFDGVTDPLEATNAELTNLFPFLTVTLDGGVVQGYDTADTGFC